LRKASAGGDRQKIIEGIDHGACHPTRISLRISQFVFAFLLIVSFIATTQTLAA